MMDYVMFAIIFTFLKLCPAEPEILEPLQNQYGLIGSNITMSCKTRGGMDVFWVLNGTSITISHQITEKRYKEMGVEFTEMVNETSGYHNLTMIIPAIVPMNNTRIYCAVRDSSTAISAVSDEVYFIIFDNFNPYPPFVTVEVHYSSSLPPTLHATIHGVPRWPDYEIIEYQVNITDTSDNSLVNQTIIVSNNLGSNTVEFNESLQSSLALKCSILRISVSAVSVTYGESGFTQVNTEILSTPGDLQDTSINCTTLFYPDGTLFQLVVQVKLPDLCTYEGVNYTIIIKEDVDNAEANTILNGPYYHQGPGIVSHEIRGLKNDHTYSAKLQVNHISGISESVKYYFNTNLHLTHSSIPCNGSVSQGSDGYSFILAMGVSLGIVVLLLMGLCVAFICLCVSYIQKKPQSECQANNRCMMHNPIYDGPMYESISGDTAQRHNPTMAMSTAPADHKIVPPLRYVGEPTQLLSLNQQGKPVTPDDYDHLVDRKGNDGIENTVISTIEMEETYTVMSPAGTLTYHSQC